MRTAVSSQAIAAPTVRACSRFLRARQRLPTISAALYRIPDCGREGVGMGRGVSVLLAAGRRVFVRSRPFTALLAWLALVSATGLAMMTSTPAAAATRDILVHFTNNSDSVLTRTDVTLDHGCWADEPPLKIEIDQTVDIHSESCGVATGTEFHVSYALDNGTELSLHYDNPFLGSDTFDENAPEGYAFQVSGVIEDRTTRFGCDSPCDGIPLDWKKNGVTIDPGSGNPPQFVDLPSMGVSLDRPNILVQLDWMQDATHNQQLRQAAIDTVIEAFDQDPVVHRGSTRPGITLIIDAGPNSTLSPGGGKWGALSRAKQVPWTQYFLTGNRDDGYQLANFYSLLKSNFVPTGRLPSFHYAIAAAVIAQDKRPTPPVNDNTSGLTPPDKLGFIVTLGGWTDGIGSQPEQIGTFMHEFGHTLGLDHSGGEGDADSVNRKPNYPSVMSYAYQTNGIFRGGVLVFDYSRDTMPDVDETKLTEAGGVDLGANPSGYGSTNSCGTKDASGTLTITRTYVQKNLEPVDWSCDGGTNTPGTGFDANGDTVQGTLKGSAPDWPRIKFRTGGVGEGSDAKDTVTIPSSGISQPHHDITYEESRRILVLPLDATLTYKGATTGDYHDSAAMSATLVSSGDGSPAVGKIIKFQIGPSSTDVCAATTDGTGAASCSIKVSQASGPSTVTASFAGDSFFKAASDSRSFTITREETTLSFTGPTVILAGSGSTTLSAKLVEDGASDDDGDGGAAAPNPSGQTITFTLGAQSCSGTTDATGAATCSIANVSGQTLGSKTLTATFAGDTYYRPSSASADVIVFAFPSRGAFVLGDTTIATATPGTPVTWWSPDWSFQNSLSGGIAPDAFKGFAGTVTTLPTTTPANNCGTTFLTRSGNSTPPTADVPTYMGVIVGSSVTKGQQGNISGAWGQIVVVKTNPGYSPATGHRGTGEIVATFCK